MSSRERLLLLYGPEGLEDLTRDAQKIVESVETHISRFTTLTIAVGRRMGVLEDPEEVPLEVLRKRALEGKGLIVSDVFQELDAILKKARENPNE